MGIINEGIKVFNQLRNDEDFTANTGDFTTTVKANVEEVIMIQSTFRLEWEVLASPTLNGNQFVVTLVAGSIKSIQSTGLNFNEFRVGDVFTFDDFAGATTYTGAVATLVSGSYMEFDDTASGIPASLTPYADALIFGTTDLDTLEYKFNFPAASDSNNLISDVFGLIPEFSFSAIPIGGGDIAGVPKNPIFWNGGSAIARRLPTVNGNQFVYQVDLIVFIPHYTESQFTNLITQKRTDVFQVETQFFAQRASFQSGDDAETNRTLDISRPVNDSIGWFNENFDGGDRQYSVVSIDLTELSSGDEREVLEVTETTLVSFVIAANDTTFVTLGPLQAKFSYLPPDQTVQESEEDLTDTYLYEGLRTRIDDPNTDGTIITELDVNLDSPTAISGSFRIEFTPDQQNKIISNGNYVLSFLLANSVADQETVNRLNLILQAENFTKNTDISGLVALNIDDVYYLPDTFTLGVTDGATNLIEWNEGVIMRDIEIDLEVEIDQLVTIEGLRIIIGAYNPTTDDFFEIDTVVMPTVLFGELLETGGYRVPIYDVDDKRGFKLPEGSIFDLLRLTLGGFSSGTQTFTIQVGQMVPWQYWVALTGANTAFYDSGEPNNGLNLLTSRYSGVNGYDIRIATEIDVKKNNGLEDVITTYQFLSEDGEAFDFGTNSTFTPTIEYFDENDVLLPKTAGVGYLPIDGLIKVVVTWDDGNTKTSIGNFEAEIRLELKEQGTQKSKHIISSVDGVIPSDILKPIEGETLLLKEIIAGNYTAKCLIDGALGLPVKYSLSEELYETLVNMSLNFDGVDEYHSFTSLNIGKTYTMSAWIKWDSLGGIPIGRSSTPNARYFFLTSGGNVFVNRDEEFRSWPFTPTLGVWYNMVSVRNNSLNEELFINGVSQGTRAFTINPDMLIGFFGAQTASVQFFEGNLHQITRWNAAMNGTEALELYNLGCPAPPSSHSLSANAQNWWIMAGPGDTFISIIDQIGSSNTTGFNQAPSNIEAVTPC